jgi:hypothetical protein
MRSAAEPVGSVVELAPLMAGLTCAIEARLARERITARYRRAAKRV